MSSVLEYKCPACGGTISFDSTTQMMKCPYCESEFDVEALKKYDEILNSAAKEDDMSWSQYDEQSGSGDWTESEKDGIVKYSCSSCGGEIIGDRNTAATSCPYCGSTVIVPEKLSGMLRPDYVIPFKLDREAAKEKLREFTSKRPLLPRLFSSEHRINEVTGIYVPFWLYDCDADAAIRYKATKTTAWSDSRYNYVKTDTYSLIREGIVSFAGVPEDGSSKMDDAMMEALEPFDYSQAVDFQTAYLAGYLADKYDVTAEECSERANSRIRKTTEDRFAETASGYASCIAEDSKINVLSGKINYALLPVWILNTEYKGKMYKFAMNGQTGKMIGDLPVSRAKYWLYFAAIFAGCAGIGTLLAYLFLR